MQTSRTKPRSVFATTIVAGALASMALAAGNAQAYPPDPGGGETPDEVIVEPPTDVQSAGGTAGTQGSLPSTGNSGVSTTLLAAGSALLLGVGMTGWSVVSNRRQSTPDAPES